MTTATNVVQLASAQVDEAGGVLGRAFHDDPYWSWVLPDDSRRARALPWFMTVWVRYCLRYREVYTTAEKVEGVAAWIPPGEYPISVARLMLTGMALVFLRLGPGPSRRLMNSTGYLDRVHARDVPTRHWYLPTLGVDPPRQGQGLGGALLQPILTRADKDGLHCYLETEKEINVRFYRKHGFDVVVETDLAGDGPHIWTMRREPKG